MVNVKVLDGGLGTQLSVYVGDEIDGNPLWTSRYVILKPDDIIKSHLDFLRAGAEMIEVYSYQAFVKGYMDHMNATEEEAISYIKKAGELAVEAKNIYLKENPNAIIDVVGAIGPYGAHLHDGSEYTGAYSDTITADMIKATQRPRIKALMQAGIRTFAFETIPIKREALVVLELLEEFPDIKCWISFSCKDDKCLASGDDFKETAIYCYNKNPKQIIAVGVNCLSPVNVHNLFSGINEGRDEKNLIPLVVYTSRGEEYTADKGYVFKEHVEPVYTFVKDWIDLGARYIGGCCRTTSEDVSQIRKEVDKLKTA